MSTINFYRAGGAYGQFSNFWGAPIVIDGVRWPTTEHFFQAAKFFQTDPDWAERIRTAETAKKAAYKGRSRIHPLRSDWEEVKDSIMYSTLLAKFTQHRSLRELLLNTGDADLVEHTTNDHYWGDGGDGSGKNMLGKLLMKVRKMLSDVRP